MIESTEALLERDEFNVFVPDVVGLLEKSGSAEGESRAIGGYCSTEDLDRQDEVVVAKGLDFSEFVKHGWFNDNHKQATADKIGFPRLAVLKGLRWYTEGDLVAGYPPAEQIYNLAKALHKSGAPRRLGFSIEGKVIERDMGNRILKAKIRNVAITGDPVNTACSWTLLVAKAFAPVEDVVRASDRSSAVFRSMGAAEDAVVAKSMSSEEAVARLRKLRPDINLSLCRMIVAYAQKEGRR